MRPRSLVAAIDQGTTSSRCILFDRSGQPVASHQLEHAQLTPRPGWVEHDADEILERVRTCVRVALRESGADARALAAVGISNQRETTVVWSRRTGRPVHNAIVWQDTRTATACERLAADGGVDRFRDLTGLPISTYSSALKLAWILEDGGPERRAAAEAGDLLFGTIDSWLIWHLTGGIDGGVHSIDVTNASRTMLMGLESLAWEPALLDAIGIPAADAASDPVLVRGLRPWCRRSGRRADLRATWATNTRRSSGRHVSRLARANAPTGPVASCSCTPAIARSRRSTG